VDCALGQSTLLKRKLFIFKPDDWNFYTLRDNEMSKYLSCKFSKKLLDFFFENLQEKYFEIS